MAAPNKISKKEKTRLQLIEAGIAVLAQKSMDSASIDEVAILAGVARGTFYNYFSSRDELLRSISEHIRQQLAIELFDLIPADYHVEERTACILYGFVAYAVAHPHIGWALVRIGGSAHWLQPQTYTPNILALESFLRLQEPPMPVHLAMHYVEGSSLIAVRRRLEQVITEDESDQLLYLVLRGLLEDHANIPNLFNIGKNFTQNELFHPAKK